ncbi:LysR family transcriptional regulator [Marinomonas spartinae]|uniref:LysR family transcriptional regulator n=1 Tax=Marinomonas spartinae TaxID=1792290 RepID=UPI0018F22093|nr:LysR family transcriptional regulator [Marinomonas spartinae]MBJ7556801.1 LysR family transcriptional regulator [Marinomonas spartinae]
MDIGAHQLRYFKEVARHKSINKAAKILHISQPTLSRRMQNLEIQMRTTLFIRSPKGIELTDSGNELFKLAYAISGTFSGLQHGQSDTVSVKEDLYSIGIAPSLSNLILPELFKLIGDNQSRFPMKVQEGTTLGLSNLIDDGEIIGALISGYISPAKYDSVRLWDEPLYYIYPTNKELEVPLIVSSQDHLIRDIIKNNARVYKDKGTPNHEIYSAPNIITLIKNGLARSVLPYSIAYEHFENENIVFHKLEGIRLTRYFIWSKSTKNRTEIPSIISLISSAIDSIIDRRNENEIRKLL